MMAKGKYSETGLWIAPYEQNQEEQNLQALIFAISRDHKLSQYEREYLIERGYDPDTGEYIK